MASVPRPSASSCQIATTPCWLSARSAIARSITGSVCVFPPSSRVFSMASDLRACGDPKITPSAPRATMGDVPLTLVLGPANSAKAGEVLGGFAAAAQRGAILVVPTSVDANHFSRELARDGAVLGSVLTFNGLASEIARQLTREVVGVHGGGHD